MDKEIVNQDIDWDEKTNVCTLITKYADGSILSEPMTSEEAARWTAEHKY